MARALQRCNKATKPRFRQAPMIYPEKTRPASESVDHPTQDQASEPSEDHPEPLLEPSEDVELRGPLMVRNMPAHDEIFFRKLSDKLKKKSAGEKKLPFRLCSKSLPVVWTDRASWIRGTARKQRSGCPGPGPGRPDSAP